MDQNAHKRPGEASVKLKGGGNLQWWVCVRLFLKTGHEQSLALIGFVKPLTCGQASHLEVTLPSLLSFIVF